MMSSAATFGVFAVSIMVMVGAISPSDDQYAKRISLHQEEGDQSISVTSSGMGVSNTETAPNSDKPKTSLMRAEPGMDGDGVHLEDANLHHQDHHEDDFHGQELINSLAQLDADSEFLPALGMSNPADIAYRAMDIMMGIASVIDEDYPFVCICLDSGKCEEKLPEDKKQGCPTRVGQKTDAAGTSCGLAVLFATLVACIK